MTSDRFHKAAQDGNLDILKEATKRDCNSRAEDGMTPTLWAAFHGNLEALRLLVGRGGDVDKADYFGNSALHFAAAKGHMPCVTFLANFGANLWSLDIDSHTPKELAAMNNRDEILRFLDSAAAKEENTNRKRVKEQKEKAQKDAEKRSKKYGKLHKQAEKEAEMELKRIEKERENMRNDDLSRKSTVFSVLKMNKPHRKGGSINGGSSISNGSLPFSEIVNNSSSGYLSTSKKMAVGGVQKKVQQKLKSQGSNGRVGGGDFKVVEVEDGGKRSVRSLTGLQRDSEIIYVGSYEQGVNKRGKIADVFNTKGELTRSNSEPDFMHNTDSGFGDEVLIQEPASIFDRPGFGSVAFRNSITATLNTLPRDDRDSSATMSSDRSDAKNGSGAEECSIGSAGSLAHRNRNVPWDEEDVDSDEDVRDSNDLSPIETFLMSSGLREYTNRFLKEQIDLEALMLLTDDDLKSLDLPLGPRRKLTKAIENRRAVMENPGEVYDSRL